MCVIRFQTLEPLVLAGMIHRLFSAFDKAVQHGRLFKVRQPFGPIHLRVFHVTRMLHFRLGRCFVPNYYCRTFQSLKSTCFITPSHHLRQRTEMQSNF